ncbi:MULTISPECIES: SPOR domain-containing protein [unclassified Leisingera]|uniref:SPOR domain-containing protein n=1 Tax=unclassified Leisingera TaxID=2614906 RepID=UPI00030DEAED|nr:MULTISPECIES: SPOR domain-containing protein [unclassified Leisingera]KIC26489.1 sporulation protein [Leisingera sp. ANG-S3]KIC33491.1 sporulation protein [Leisingera sp. ANG-S5]KIC52808.1 sporulation protein [Leisingera sp. ANG-S]KID10205.1 sporulation protein [Leisingera sp. ANG1]
MAYFAQAGQGHAYSQGDGRQQDTATGGSYGQQYSDQTYAGQQYTGPGAEPAYGYEDPAYGYQPEGQGYGADEYAAYAAAPAGLRARFSKSLSILGAVASIALVAGVGFWGYKLVMRDVSGVPVVRAAEGPMREQPANPGGSQADHQGLAVNAVAARGSAEAPADRLTLAPSAIELTEDDKPLPELAAEAAPVADVPAAPAEPEAPAALGAETGVSEEAVASFQNGDIDALVAELAREAEDVSAAVPASAAAPAIVQPEPLQPALAAATVSPALLNAPGVKVSLRPSARPARFSPAPAAAAPAARAGTVDVDPATLAAGTRLAQLGAYESPEVARAEWDRISARFPEYLETKQRVIQRAESGGRTFYRLRAMGFDGLSDARRFCSALVAGNADCIPVTTR